MKAVFLFGILSILCFGCKDKKEAFTEKIAGTSEKYWDCYGRIKNGEKNFSEKPKMCMIFNVNGDHFHYNYYKDSTMYDSSESSDIEYENKWEYVNENYMELNGRKVEVLFLSEDSLVCEYEGGGEGVYFFIPRKKKAKIVHVEWTYTIKEID